LLCDRQAKAAAGRARAVQAVEALEELVALLGGNPGTLVLDLEHRGALAPQRADAYRSPRGSVEKRVLDEDPPDLEDAQLVCSCDGAVVLLELEPVPARARSGAELLDQLLAEVREIHRLAVDRHPARVE